MDRINLQVEHLRRLNEILRKRLEDRLKDPADFPLTGCGDGSCIIARPGGMHTNGGCQCDARKLRSAVDWWKRKAEFLEETIRAMKGGLDHVGSSPQTGV